MATPEATAPGQRIAPFLRSLGGYVYLLPLLAVFGFFSWYPLVRGVILSFQYDNLVAAPRWIGLENFRYVFDDPLFATAWKNTFEFMLLGLVLGFALPFLIAVALNEIRHWSWYFRLMVYMPVMLPPVVSILLWKWFYDPDTGLFNTLLEAGRLPTSSWIHSPSTAMFALVLANVWANFGATALIYLAGLQSISGSLYEAAEIDGAGFFRRLWHVTMPQMRYLLLVILLLQVIGSMQIFTEPYVMTDGGPDDATITVALLIYDYAFIQNDYGGAAALSVMLALVLGVLTAVYLLLTRRVSRD